MKTKYDLSHPFQKALPVGEDHHKTLNQGYTVLIDPLFWSLLHPMKKLPSFWFMTFFLGLSPLWGSPGLTLTVREKGSGIPLARVQIEASGQTFFTDPKGEVTLSSTGGILRFSKKGYEPLEMDLSPDFGAGPMPDVFLYPALSEENLVIVEGKKRPQISRKSISMDESRKIAPGGDPAQGIKLLPGVQTSARSSEVIIRGSGPRDSMYFIDDLEVPFVFHRIGNLSLLPPLLMDQVDFDAGGFGPEYGNATGGIITIRTTKDIPERPKTEITANIPFYSGVFHTRPLSEDSSLSLGIRRSYAEFFVNQILKNQKGSITLIPYFGDLTGMYLLKKEGRTRKLTLLASQDGIRASIPSDSFADEEGRANLDLETGFINLGWEEAGRLDSLWKYRTTPQVFYYKTKFNIADNLFRLTVTSLRAPTHFTKKISPNGEWTLGIDPNVGWARVELDSFEFRNGDPTFDPEDAPKRTLTQTVPFQNLGFWTGVDYALTPELTLSPGIRAFYATIIQKFSFDPRLRARYALSETQTLKAALGQYSQVPEYASASKDFGNPDLGYTRSIHSVLGLETRWSDAWTTDIQGFYKDINQKVVPDLTTRYSNKGQAQSLGGEFFLRRNQIDRLFGWLSYTYSKTKERNTKEDPFRDSPYDQTHILNLTGNYKLTALWDLGGRYNYHTGDTYTPVEGRVYNATLDKYQKRTRESQRNSKRLDDYHSLTCYGTKDFLFDTWKMTLKFGLESYWPKPQVMGMGSNFDYTKEEKQYGLSAIPFLELRGEL